MPTDVDGGLSREYILRRRGATALVASFAVGQRPAGGSFSRASTASLVNNFPDQVASFAPGGDTSAATITRASTATYRASV